MARGTLLVVATPIGNLDDLTPRAREALAGAALVAAEDTRRTGQLLAHLGLRRPLVACHRFSEARTVAQILGELERGAAVALVTDGGTPAVSDPGYRLVAAAHEAGHDVRAVPGASAVAAALSVAGLPADSFHFAGFLPSRRPARRREIERLAPIADTLVLFEAPHRLVECLADLSELLGVRTAVICRELTKLHEEVRRGTLAELHAEFAARERVLGEIVLVIAGARGPAPAATAAEPDLPSRFVAALRDQDEDVERALHHLARELGIARAELRRRLQL